MKVSEIEIIDCEQRSDEWRKVKAGVVSATGISAIMANGKGRDTYMKRLARERRGGQMEESYTSPAMQWGIDHEDEARQAYGNKYGVTVQQVGFVKLNDWVGVSPDGLVGSDGLIEIKCPNTNTHVDYCNCGIPFKYSWQVQCQLWATNRKWCDFVSYDPRYTEPLYINRVFRDEAEITEMKIAVEQFIEELKLRIGEKKMKTDLTVFDPVKAEMAKYKEQNASLVFDYEDPTENKLARSHVAKMRKIKTKISEVHKELKADALAFGRSVDAEKNGLITEVDSWIDVHAIPLKEIADREKKEQEAIDQMERAEAEKIEADRLEAIRVQEEAVAAEATKLQAERIQLELDKEKLAVAKKAEADAQQRVQEEKERAEQEKIEAAAKAEQDKQAAVEAEKEKARQVEADRQAEIEADKAAAAELVSEERERVENEVHRGQVEGKICSQIREIVDEYEQLEGYDTATAILDALKQGEIKNLIINY